MNKKNSLALGVIASLIASPIFASNVFEKFLPMHAKSNSPHALSAKTKAKKLQGSFTDFSGNWIGSCSEEPGIEEQLTIENTDTDITINGDMFFIGVLETRAYSANGASFFNLALDWNEASTNLLINGTQTSYFPNYAEANNFSYFKGSMALKDDQLVFEMSLSSAKGTESGVCTYHKQ